ncbi:hypothetical protein ACSQ67_015763 [Phaseolus vulgaris]
MAEIEAQTYVKLFLIWLLFTIVVRAILWSTRRHPRRPPGPPSLPVIGHLHLISALPHQSFHALAARHGPIMQIFLGSVSCVVVSCPEMAKEFLKAHERSFSNRFVSAAVHQLSYESKGFLFARYGRFWKFMKKICMSELLGSRTLDHFRHVPADVAEEGEAREAVDLGGELLTLMNSIISRMVLGRRWCESEGEVEEVRKMVKDTAEVAGEFNVGDFVWLCKGLDLQRMKKRVGKIHERDLLHILWDIHEDESREMKLTRENVKAFILDIFMAGTDTSSITMEWALAELLRNPNVMEKAREEIDSVTGNSSRLIEESDVVNLPYMRAIVKETLRLHPTSPMIGRESSENINVCGFDIREKTWLLVNLWSMGRDPKVWEKPLEFRPERFMGEEKQFDVRGQNFQLMPFGTGRRACPGASLALQVVPSNLAAMVQCFEWKVEGSVSMEEKPSMTLPRAHPLVCVPVPRLSLSF